LRDHIVPSVRIRIGQHSGSFQTFDPNAPSHEGAAAVSVSSDTGNGWTVSSKEASATGVPVKIVESNLEADNGMIHVYGAASSDPSAATLLASPELRMPTEGRIQFVRSTSNSTAALGSILDTLDSACYAQVRNVLEAAGDQTEATTLLLPTQSAWESMPAEDILFLKSGSHLACNVVVSLIKYHTVAGYYVLHQDDLPGLDAIGGIAFRSMLGAIMEGRFYPTTNSFTFRTAEALDEVKANVATKVGGVETLHGPVVPVDAVLLISSIRQYFPSYQAQLALGSNLLRHVLGVTEDVRYSLMKGIASELVRNETRPIRDYKNSDSYNGKYIFLMASDSSISAQFSSVCPAISEWLGCFPDHAAFVVS